MQTFGVTCATAKFSHSALFFFPCPAVRIDAFISLEAGAIDLVLCGHCNGIWSPIKMQKTAFLKANNLQLYAVLSMKSNPFLLDGMA